VIKLGAAVAEMALSIEVAPVIGVVAAIVGIILSIVELFIGKPKPGPTTAEIFFRKQGVEFLDSLPMPPPEWKPLGEKH